MNRDATQEWAVLYQGRTSRSCRERALVLESRGFPVRIRRNGSDHLLLVPMDRWHRALAELDAWESENHGWPPVDEEVPDPADRRLGKWSVLVYGGVLLVMHWVAVRRFGHFNWTEAGLCDSQRVLAGEWWRCVTSLTLHADAVHLCGNLLFGALFTALVVRHLGSGVAWLTILGAGALGNLINVSVRSEPFRSLGASTSVFAAVGILAAIGWQRKRRAGFGLVRQLGPLVVSVWILSFLGTGGERTDVLGHCTGLLAGIIVGVRASRHREPAPPPTQHVAAVTSVLILLVGWTLARGLG